MWEILDDLNVKKKFLIFSIAIALINLINVKTDFIFLLYYFALIFFVAGLAVAVIAPYIGLIFLLSHGGIGLWLMVKSVIGNIIVSPIMQDNPANANTYLNVAYSFFIAATVFMIIYNVSSKFKDKEHSIDIPLVLYFIGMLMIVIFPRIVTYLCG